MALQITTKSCWLMRQMNVPGLLQKPKKKNLIRLSAKPENSDTAPKTCWSILSKFLRNRKTSNIPLIFVNGKVV